MLTLYGFGPLFGLPDPSPFVLKTMTQLKMAGLPFRFERADPREAPKGKIPFIRDGDVVLGDSVFILDHLKRAHGVELDAHLTPQQRSLGWALERMLEDHLYWAIVHARWAIDENFEKGPAQFFAGMPDAVKHERPGGGEADALRPGLRPPRADARSPISPRATSRPPRTSWRQAVPVRRASPASMDATLFAFTASAATPFFDTLDPPGRRALPEPGRLPVADDGPLLRAGVLGVARQAGFAPRILRQVVGDRQPRGFRGDVEVERRLGRGRLVERAGTHPHHAGIAGAAADDRRAALAAEQPLLAARLLR